MKVVGRTKTKMTFLFSYLATQRGPEPHLHLHQFVLPHLIKAKRNETTAVSFIAGGRLQQTGICVEQSAACCVLVLLPELYLVRNLGRVFIDTFQAEPLKHIHLLRKTAFLSHLYIKTIVLPRQARDKHRKR